MADIDPDAWISAKTAQKQDIASPDVDAWLAAKADDSKHSSEEYDDKTYVDNRLKYGAEYADKYRTATAYNNKGQKGEFNQKEADRAAARKKAHDDTLQAVDIEKKKRAVEDETLYDKFAGVLGTTVRTGASIPGGLVSGTLEMLHLPKAADWVDKQVAETTPLTPAGQRYTEKLGQAIQNSGVQGLAPEVGNIGRAAAISRETEAAQTGLKAAANMAEKTVPIAAASTDVASELATKGYKFAPSNVQPSALGRVTEMTAGGTKKVAGEMSENINQPNTNKLGKEDLGLPPSMALSEERYESYRTKQFEDGYKPLYNVKAPVRLTPEALQKLDAVAAEQEVFLNGTPHVANIAKKLKTVAEGGTTEQAVDTIRTLRTLADKLKKGDGNAREAATVYRAAANAVEDSIDSALSVSKNSADKKALEGYQTARKNIAKSYTYEEATDPQGNIDAKKVSDIASKLKERGVDVDGNMKTIADFGTHFPEEAALPKDPNTTRSLKEQLLHGVQNKVLQSDYGQRKMAGVQKAPPPAPPPEPKPLSLADAGAPIPSNAPTFQPKTPEGRGLLSLADKGTEESIPRDQSNTLRERHDVPTEEFPLRQEVLQRPEVQAKINEFRQQAAELEPVAKNAISARVRENAQRKLQQLQQEFAEFMKQYGVTDAASATGINRPLYETGKGTQLPIQQTYTPQRSLKDAQP